MEFDKLDSEMRKFERLPDICIPADSYIVVRIDGRNFTRLTKEVCAFEAPFDEKFRDYMIGTVLHLMQCGFRILYGYTESDEISLLFHPTENAFGRKTRKLNSILAGEASAAFTHLLGQPAAFDCRVIPLPTVERVQDYFRWRQEDANRNALNAHCYWMLRKEGCSVQQATKQIEGQSVLWKKELLASRGITYADFPAWQRHGIGVWWETYEKPGYDPKTGSETVAVRTRLHTEQELPTKEMYAARIAQLLAGEI